MKVAKVFLLLATIPVFSFAQRGGGGHAGGGGGFRGGGGGGMARPGGGGFSGGGMRAPSGGAIRSPGFSSGGFHGGTVTGGVSRGGFVSPGFNRGFNSGFNRGFVSTGFNHFGVNHFGFNRTFVSVGFWPGFGWGWPYWGWGWGWPAWGWGWGWPVGYWGGGWSGGWGDPVGSDPYLYNAYPDYTYSTPSTTPTGSYSPTPPPSGTSSESYYRKPDYYLIAFNDHTIQAAIEYHLEGDELVFTTREHEQRRVPISSVDRRFTEQINRDRRVEIHLP